MDPRAVLGLRSFATECGDLAANDTRQAVCLLRRVASLWGMEVLPIVYAFGEGSSLDMTSGPSSYAARQSYTALGALMTIVAARGGPGGSANNVPGLIAAPDLLRPLMTGGVYGTAGSLLLAWQRTWSPNAVN